LRKLKKETKNANTKANEFSDEKVQNKEELKQWNDNSLLKDILKYYYEKENKMKYFYEDSKILTNDRLDYLKEWKSLTEEQKDKDGYPRGLRTILDEAAGIKNFEIF